MRQFLPLLLLAGCSLTPIPDVTSSYVPPCDETNRLCPVPFTLSGGTETSVELRGDFRDGGWVDGEPMVLDGGTWSATITASWGADVQYKFFVDGTTWIVDPGNPDSVPDGKGNTNSIKYDVTCAEWTCATTK